MRLKIQNVVASATLNQKVDARRFIDNKLICFEDITHRTIRHYTVLLGSISLPFVFKFQHYSRIQSCLLSESNVSSNID